jgi:hypothetical protein
MGLLVSVMPSSRPSEQVSPAARAPDPPSSQPVTHAAAPPPASAAARSLWNDSPRSATSGSGGPVAGRDGAVGAELAPSGWGQPLSVTRLDPAGPALASGMVAPGDLLLEVDGRDVRGVSQRAAEELLHGPPGSVVTLTLQRGARNFPHKASVTRAPPARADGPSAPLALAAAARPPSQTGAAPAADGGARRGPHGPLADYVQSLLSPKAWDGRPQPAAFRPTTPPVSAPPTPAPKLFQQAHSHMCTHGCTRSHTHSHAHAQSYTRRRMRTRAHTYLRTHSCARARMRARTHARASMTDVSEELGTS